MKLALAQIDLRAFGQAHIHDAPPHRPFAVQADHRSGLPYFEFFQSVHTVNLPISLRHGVMPRDRPVSGHQNPHGQGAVQCNAACLYL